MKTTSTEALEISFGSTYCLLSWTNCIRT